VEPQRTVGSRKLCIGLDMVPPFGVDRKRGWDLKPGGTTAVDCIKTSLHRCSHARALEALLLHTPGVRSCYLSQPWSTSVSLFPAEPVV
jgi:hypothetical protein